VTLTQWVDVASISASVIAVVTFITATYRYLKNSIEKDRLDLLRSNVQKLFQTQVESLSFDQIKVFLNKQPDVTSNDLRKIRLVLMDLCEKNIIVQMGNDQYQASQYQKYMESYSEKQLNMVEINEKIAEITIRNAKTQEGIMREQLALLSEQSGNTAEVLELQRTLSDKVQTSGG
jgi:hypothetical protein